MGLMAQPWGPGRYWGPGIGAESVGSAHGLEVGGGAGERERSWVNQDWQSQWVMVP